MLLAPRGVFALALVATVAVAITACGARSQLLFDPDDGAAGRPNDLAAVADGCAAFADASCQKLVACDPLHHSYGTAQPSFSFRDAAQCRERFALACKESASLPGATAVADQARVCASSLTSGGCSDFPDLRLNAWPWMCAVSGGTLATGSACRQGLQCATGTCSGTGSFCGVCAETLAHGASCSTSKGASCGPGSICLQGVCRPLPAGGEACAPQTPCAQGFDCVAGTCTSPYAPSAPCGGSACSAANESICDATSRCVPLQVAPPLGGCGYVSGPSVGVPVVCPAEQACVDQNDFGRGRCRPLVREGEACDSFAGPACLFPAFCAVDTCRLAASCSLR